MNINVFRSTARSAAQWRLPAYLVLAPSLCVSHAKCVNV